MGISGTYHCTRRKMEGRCSPHMWKASKDWYTFSWEYLRKSSSQSLLLQSKLHRSSDKLGILMEHREHQPGMSSLKSKHSFQLGLRYSKVVVVNRYLFCKLSSLCCCLILGKFRNVESKPCICLDRWCNSPSDFKHDVRLAYAWTFSANFWGRWAWYTFRLWTLVLVSYSNTTATLPSAPLELRTHYFNLQVMIDSLSIVWSVNSLFGSKNGRGFRMPKSWSSVHRIHLRYNLDTILCSWYCSYLCIDYCTNHLWTRSSPKSTRKFYRTYRETIVTPNFVLSQI